MLVRNGRESLFSLWNTNLPWKCIYFKLPTKKQRYKVKDHLKIWHGVKKGKMLHNNYLPLAWFPRHLLIYIISLPHASGFSRIESLFGTTKMTTSWNFLGFLALTSSNISSHRNLHTTNKTRDKKFILFYVELCRMRTLIYPLKPKLNPN